MKGNQNMEKGKGGRREVGKEGRGNQSLQKALGCHIARIAREQENVTFKKKGEKRKKNPFK